MSEIKFNIYNQSNEVFLSKSSIVNLNKDLVEFLKSKAKLSIKKKSRLLLHRNEDENLHGMLIVHTKGQYIRPHINVYHSKSWHVIEGALKCVIFDENGSIKDSWIIGTYS